MIDPVNYLLTSVVPRLGLDCIIDWSVEGSGWDIVLPEVKFNYDTFVILNFVKPFTVVDNQVFELEKVEFYYSEHNSRVIVLHNDLNIEKIFSRNLMLVYVNNRCIDVIDDFISKLSNFQEIDLDLRII